MHLMFTSSASSAREGHTCRIKAHTAVVLWIREEEHSLLLQMAKENLAKKQSDDEQQLLMPPKADLLTDSRGGW